MKIASDYNKSGDVKKAETSLTELKIPNASQYVAYLADRYISQGKEANDPDLLSIIHLAQALGKSTENMIAYISSPTATATATNTMVPTATPMPSPTKTPQPTPTSAATGTPVPTATNTPKPESAEPKPTKAPAPTATETPAPTPQVDFVVKEYRMLSKEENGGCIGMHNIFMSVLDVNGSPLPGVKIGDPSWAGNIKNSSDKNEPFRNWGTKMAEIDLQKNGATVRVLEYPVGNPVTSQSAPLFSSNDWEIPLDWLAKAGYCGSISECDSRIAKPGASTGNSLCWGHYSFWVVFQATHPF